MERECPNCGKEMNVDKYINETTIITSCKFCHRIFKITYDEKKVPNNINNFNWGAFSLWHLWGFWNGMPILSCFGILLGLIANTFYLLFIIDIAISLYLGLQGNKLSWQKKDWSSATNFEIHQKRWNITHYPKVIIDFSLFLLVLLLFIPYMNILKRLTLFSSRC